MEKPVFSNSFQQFLIGIRDESRVARLILSTADMFNLGYVELLPKVLRTDEVNYITYRSDGNISFLPAGKEHIVNDDGTWSRSNRQDGKPARVIRKLFTERALKVLNDKDFEVFNNRYKSKYSIDGYTFRLLSNEDIPDVYDMDREEGGASLNSSCMNNDSNYLDIYKYCNKLQILILIKDDLLAGRALVWSLDDNITLMDRVYVSNDHLYDVFLDHAKERGWWRKQDYKSYSNKRNFVTPDGCLVTRTFKVFTDTEHDNYPYIDTFTYGGNGYLVNSNSDYVYEYTNTDGTRDGDENAGRVYDEINDEYIDEDSAVYIEYGERRFRDRTTHIDNAVQVDGCWYHEDDENIVEIDNTWYRKDDENICCIDNEYYHIDDCCIDEYNGEWALQDDCVYSEYTNGYILKSEAYKCGDKYYHESDVEKLD